MMANSNWMSGADYLTIRVVWLWNKLYRERLGVPLGEDVWMYLDSWNEQGDEL